MGNWRIWHSAISFGNFIVDNTKLSEIKDQIEFKQLPESDAAKSGTFHKVPDHIKKILYLDAADLIIEYNSEPILCIEETKEAGTGHNSFQRFARIAAAVENGVPAIYIMPEGCIIERQRRGSSSDSSDVIAKWDSINPMVFYAYNSVMDIFKIPALFFYYPSDYQEYKESPQDSPNYNTKGLKFNTDFEYSGCPIADDDEMGCLFKIIDTIIDNAISGSSVSKLIDKKIIRERKYWMQKQFYEKANNKEISEMSPITATVTIETEKLLNYLSKFTDVDTDEISELLSSRPETVIYQCDAGFRGDPYAGTLSAIDYILCRQGRTYEERESNLVLCFGHINELSDSIEVKSTKCSVDDFVHTVHNCVGKNLLTKERYRDIKPRDIGRYYMQVRYGSTYSKVKHIRVFSYFADAIIFKDGAVWREG